MYIGDAERGARRPYSGQIFSKGEARVTMWMILLACGEESSKTVGQQDSGSDFVDFDVAVERIPAGTFEMGCTEGDDACGMNESPVHTVEITSDYYLMQTEVTQGLYEAVMGINPAEFQLGADYPLEEVNWYDAIQFANTLSELEGREVCYAITEADEGQTQVSWENKACTGWRLPTEAEWEYAARGGDAYIYAGHADPDLVAWFEDNAEEQTHPVAQKLPNGFGLYDMSGNVEEWCWDGYQEGMYDMYALEGLVQDPTGPENSGDRVLRGGGWGVPANLVRVSNRIFVAAPSYRRIFGIRLARSAK